MAALFAAACSDAAGPAPKRAGPGGPLFSFSPNGIGQSGTANGALGETGDSLAKGFDPKNPHHGDAVIATVFWLGQTNIVDSVVDFVASTPNTRVGNTYHQIDYVTAGGYSMATFVATNIQNFPDSSSVSGQILAVRAFMHQRVVDGGIKISAWSGIEDNFAAALRDVAHASGTDTGGNIPAHTRPIAVNAGGIVYTATMGALDTTGAMVFTGVSEPGPPFGQLRCVGGFPCGRGSDPRYIVEEAEYAVLPSAGTVDPQWTWMYGGAAARPWLVTTFSLNVATGGTGSGNLTVTTSTTGSNLDTDGYTVTVDGSQNQPIASNNSTGITFTGLSAASHTVVLSGVASNCTVSGGNTQTVTVPPGGTATAPFSVSCAATTGNLTVNTSTSGSNLDPDGYTVTVDGGSQQALGINGSVTYTNLAAANHTLAIAGVASNCTVSGGASQTVSVPAGGTATATFTVTCTTPVGNLTVSASTSGSSLDPDGYTVTVDGGSPQALAINGSVSYTNLAAANHTVAISGVASTCTVSGSSSRTVNVPSGGTATTTFTVTCSTPPGSLTVTTSTSGSNVDQDGYTVAVDGGPGQAISINGSITFTGLAAGSHDVVVSGVAANCSVSGGSSQSVSVPSGGTATAPFSVSCAATTGDLTVTTNTSGSNLDPDGYTVTVDGTTNQAITINGSVTFTGLAGGSHTVVLSGVAGNCTVSGGASQTVSVPAGGTATLGFVVTCTALTGNLTVSASTSGSSLDPDGYSVAVDGGTGQALAINGSVTFSNLSAGGHSVQLSGVAANCSVSGSNPRTISVPSGGTATTTFTVSCSTPPGDLTVSASTSGSSLDPDGYSVAVDGGTGQALAINGSVTFSNLSAGGHSVQLSGVAANCSVSGSNPRTISVPSGGTATTTFTVSCSTPPGDLTVSASTSGSSLDPDGYSVAVDGGTGQALAINGNVRFTNLSAGSHSVQLSGVAANCTVSGSNPRTISVPSGGTATTMFTVSCVTPPGNLTVSASTSGSSLDPDGYSVAVDGGTGQALAINGSVTFTSLSAGNHSVQLSGVASNCTVSGSNPRTISVPSGGTATTTFTVSCVTPPGNLTVSASTSGSNLDPDGYTVTVDGGSPQALAINGSVSYTNLSAGNHTVAISGVASNCTVSGGTSRTVSVPSGGTATTTFTVSCVTPPGNLTVSASTSGSSLDPDGYTVTVDGGSAKALAINGSVSYTNLSAGNHTVAISGVASNCTVSGGTSRTVSVPSGGTATTTFTVSCVSPNSAPVVNAGTDETAVTGLLYSTSFSFSDANHNGPWSYTINWGDGNTSTGTLVSEGSFSAGHTYIIVLPRSFTITVTVRDAAGASGSDTKMVSVLLL